MVSLIIFLFSALVVAVAGTRLTVLADRLADRTGFGEALFGAVALGATTSISGSVLSMVSAYDGLTDLAIGNALGGIAAQTFFLVLADAVYRKANLEHAAASTTNIMLAVLLIGLLSIPVIAVALPEVTLLGIHPVTFVLFLTYLGGLQYTHQQKEQPMWVPRMTAATVQDEADEPQGGQTLGVLVAKFSVYAVLLVISGIAIKESGVALAESWGLSHLLLGTLLTATVTSLPELITTFAAVRRGALALAVGGIVGGNTFDVLFLGFSDIAYREGSIYHAMSTNHVSYIAITILMVAIVCLGLVRREQKGPANIGIESIAVGILYLFSFYFVLGGS